MPELGELGVPLLPKLMPSAQVGARLVLWRLCISLGLFRWSSLAGTDFKRPSNFPLRVELAR